jgi:hypothetical protein
MVHEQVLEGRWEDIVADNSGWLAGRRVKLLVEREATTEQSLSLDDAVSRLNSRTPEQLAEARRRLFDASADPLPVPDGKSLVDMIAGHWPGDESDEQIHDALEKLS